MLDIKDLQDLVQEFDVKNQDYLQSLPAEERLTASIDASLFLLPLKKWLDKIQNAADAKTKYNFLNKIIKLIDIRGHYFFKEDNGFFYNPNLPINELLFLLAQKLARNGAWLIIKNQFPAKPSLFPRSFLFIKKNNFRGLYFHHANGKENKITIKDFDLFEKKLHEITQDEAEVYLSIDQINALITGNGGYLFRQHVFSFLLPKFTSDVVLPEITKACELKNFFVSEEKLVSTYDFIFSRLLVDPSALLGYYDEKNAPFGLYETKDLPPLIARAGEQWQEFLYYLREFWYIQQQRKSCAENLVCLYEILSVIAADNLACPSYRMQEFIAFFNQYWQIISVRTEKIAISKTTLNGLIDNILRLFDFHRVEDRFHYSIDPAKITIAHLNNLLDIINKNKELEKINIDSEYKYNEELYQHYRMIINQSNANYCIEQQSNHEILEKKKFICCAEIITLDQENAQQCVELLIPKIRDYDELNYFFTIFNGNFKYDLKKFINNVLLSKEFNPKFSKNSEVICGILDYLKSKYLNYYFIEKLKKEFFDSLVIQCVELELNADDIIMIAQNDYRLHEVFYLRILRSMLDITTSFEQALKIADIFADVPIIITSYLEKIHQQYPEEFANINLLFSLENHDCFNQILRLCHPQLATLFSSAEKMKDALDKLPEKKQSLFLNAFLYLSTHLNNDSKDILRIIKLIYPLMDKYLDINRRVNQLIDYYFHLTITIDKFLDEVGSDDNFLIAFLSSEYSFYLWQNNKKTRNLNSLISRLPEYDKKNILEIFLTNVVPHAHLARELKPLYKIAVKYEIDIFQFCQMLSPNLLRCREQFKAIIKFINCEPLILYFNGAKGNYIHDIDLLIEIFKHINNDKRHDLFQKINFFTIEHISVIKLPLLFKLIPNLSESNQKNIQLQVKIYQNIEYFLKELSKKIPLINNDIHFISIVSKLQKLKVEPQYGPLSILRDVLSLPQKFDDHKIQYYLEIGLVKFGYLTGNLRNFILWKILQILTKNSNYETWKSYAISQTITHIFCPNNLATMELNDQYFPSHDDDNNDADTNEKFKKLRSEETALLKEIINSLRFKTVPELPNFEEFKLQYEKLEYAIKDKNNSRTEVKNKENYFSTSSFLNYEVEFIKHIVQKDIEDDLTTLKHLALIENITKQLGEQLQHKEQDNYHSYTCEFIHKKFFGYYRFFNGMYLQKGCKTVLRTLNPSSPEHQQERLLLQRISDHFEPQINYKNPCFLYEQFSNLLEELEQKSPKLVALHQWLHEICCYLNPVVEFLHNERENIVRENCSDITFFSSLISLDNLAILSQQQLLLVLDACFIAIDENKTDAKKEKRRKISELKTLFAKYQFDHFPVYVPTGAVQSIQQQNSGAAEYSSPGLSN